MSGFLKSMAISSEYQGVEHSLKKGFLPQGVLGLIPVQKAHLIASLTESLQEKALVVTPDEASAVRLCDDLVSFGVPALHFPSKSISFYANDSQSYEYEQKRIKVLRRLADGNCSVAVCSAEAAVSYTIPPDILNQKSLILKKGEEIALENILISLNSAGYKRVDSVEGVGQFSCRGGIVDFFLLMTTVL